MIKTIAIQTCAAKDQASVERQSLGKTGPQPQPGPAREAAVQRGEGNTRGPARNAPLHAAEGQRPDRTGMAGRVVHGSVCRNRAA